MGLKGYRLWVMGQLDSNVQSPTAAAAAHIATRSLTVPPPPPPPLLSEPGPGPRGVALQVAFERQTLKPVYSLDRL
jgi:hypothetical protein